MIDLTPLDVRNKRGDFKKLLRGYDPQEVDVFLELVAERLEAVVRENIQLRARAETLEQQVSSQSGRERAVQEALVTAQELRSDMRSQAQREAELILAEARARAKELELEIERRLEVREDAISELERRRMRFLKTFRQLLERELDVVEVEEGRAPLEDRPIDLDLGGGRPPEEEAETGDEKAGDVGSTSHAPVERRFEEDERPPLDAAVDELAAAHEAARAVPREPNALEGEKSSARDLLLPPQDDAAKPEDDPRWG